ncbi:MAG: DUF3810 domain-containing protein [Lachnospiraceae bacterium]|nr:DUF3810 domain-containing protein [Lachnospiraceae bacterium]
MALTVLLQTAARRLPGFGEWYAVTVYPALVRVVGAFFGMFSFSVVEFGLYLLLIGMAWHGIRQIRRPGKLLMGAGLLASILVFVYTANCGINYHRRPFSSYLNLNVRESSAEELERLAGFLAGQVKETAPVEGSASGTEGGPAQDVLARQARADMERLGERYPSLSGYYPLPKPVTVSEILSYQSLSGVYSPFTIEANYNSDMTAYNIPHTACHELSHLRGFMREEEANFIGYLACVNSDSRYSRYSGYLTGFLYVNQALFSQKPEQAAQLAASLPETVRKDLAENNRFWERYEGKIAEVSTKVNDTYLKANRQADGVKSYGRMVDLLLAFYRENEPE